MNQNYLINKYDFRIEKKICQHVNIDLLFSSKVTERTSLLIPENKVSSEKYNITVVLGEAD